MGSLLLAAGALVVLINSHEIESKSSGEKGKRHCLPNASIMIHRKIEVVMNPSCCQNFIW